MVGFLTVQVEAPSKPLPHLSVNPAHQMMTPPSRGGFGTGGVRPEPGMGLLAGDPPHPNLFGNIRLAVGLLIL